jgi:DNA adenine methylase
MIQQKPFLKWAGGKRQLLNELEGNFPPNIIETKQIDLYIEPFVGGGALLFYLLSNYSIKKSVINDINPDLMITYKVIKLFPEELIKKLREISEEYLVLSQEGRKRYFYNNLRTPYNKLKVKYNKQDKEAWIQKAALLIALNKTCFNGLFRQNSKGEFNVPIGYYKNPKILDEENINSCHIGLQNTEIYSSHYDSITISDKQNAFVYLDPPYRPLSDSSSFTKYSKEDFNDEDQKQLSEYYKKLSKKGHYLLLSNSDTKDNFFDELYKEFNIQRVFAKRHINSDSNGRGKVNELLIKNY